MEDDRLMHALRLSEDLLSDIELERVPLGSVVLKASRLARLVDDERALAWLQLELSGYEHATKDMEPWLAVTGRWVDRKAGTRWSFPAAQIDNAIASAQSQLAASTLPSISGDASLVTTNAIIHAQTSLRLDINRFTGIRAKIVAALHEMASRHYYALLFSRYQAELFDDARARIDRLLAPLASGALDKVDSIYRRLAEGDTEAVSQALNTCRRLIDSVADELFPPTDQTTSFGDGTVAKLTDHHTQNRINAFVDDHISSRTRRAKLRRTLSDLYNRVSAGVHDDVTPDEARYLFLGTYMLLGELLTLLGLDDDAVTSE